MLALLHTCKLIFYINVSRRIIWLSSSDTAVGFAAEFAAISMHAVATDPDSVDRPCLYVQLDIDDDAGQESSDEVEGSPLPELRFTPVDSSTLDAIFQAFCEGAERNPDAEAAEEGQGSLFFDQGEALAGAFEATEMSDDGEDIDRFGDAAEEDEGEEPYKTNGNTTT